MTNTEELIHFGVLGMHWGHRKTENKPFKEWTFADMWPLTSKKAAKKYNARSEKRKMYIPVKSHFKFYDLPKKAETGWKGLTPKEKKKVIVKGSMFAASALGIIGSLAYINSHM